MERIQRSLEKLDTPICQACNAEMAWSRSALIADEQTILHVFICPRCGGIGDTMTPMKAKD
jgi:predicted RNA-binding Zn-ribbon protein involved in translation (DUF1610 family)